MLFYKIKKKVKQLRLAIKFLISVVVIYIFLLLFKSNIFFGSLDKFWQLLNSVLSSLILVFVIIFLFNLFLKDKQLKNFFIKSKGWLKYLVAVVTGILSSGPIYAWYPFLSDLREQGMDDGLMAVFLYNRAVKIPLIPVMIYYFSLEFVLLLTACMIVFSVINGIIVNKLTKII